VIPVKRLAAAGTRTGGTADRRRFECRHEPRCPAADVPDHAAARVVTSHPVQGWSLLCNGVVVFDDAGELLPSGVAIAPQRPAYLPGAA
jgi:hypothetical protein